MPKIIGVMLVAAAVFTGCAEDDAEEAAFCAEFETRTAGGITGTTPETLSDTLLFFQQLEVAAPPEISDEVSTVADGLERLVGAFQDAEGTEIEQTFEAIQGAAAVDFDELAAAADRVEQFAVENCDNVSG